jgi:hypothetical protein
VPQPTIRILGAYQLPLTADVIEDAMQTWYGNRRATFSDAERSEAERFVVDELAPTVLFDLELRDIDSRFAIKDFGQPGSDQAAWDEKYVDLATGAILGRSLDPPPASSCRLLVYLHFVDTAKPLETSYGPLKIPAVRPMPDELWSIAPYQAVD